MIIVYHLRGHGTCEICGSRPDHYHMLKVTFTQGEYLFRITDPFPIRKVGQ